MERGDDKVMEEAAAGESSRTPTVTEYGLLVVAACRKRCPQWLQQQPRETGRRARWCKQTVLVPSFKEN